MDTYVQLSEDAPDLASNETQLSSPWSTLSAVDWWRTWLQFTGDPPNAVDNPKSHALMVSSWHRRLDTLSSEELQRWLHHFVTCSNSPFDTDLFCYDTPQYLLKNLNTDAYLLSKSYHKEPITNEMLENYFSNSHYNIQGRKPDITQYMLNGLRPDCSGSAIKSIFRYIQQTEQFVIDIIPNIDAYSFTFFLDAYRQDMYRLFMLNSTDGDVFSRWQSVWDTLLLKHGDDAETAFTQAVTYDTIHNIYTFYEMAKITLPIENYALFFKGLPTVIGSAVDGHVAAFYDLLKLGIFESISMATDDCVQVVDKWIESRFDRSTKMDSSSYDLGNTP